MMRSFEQLKQLKYFLFQAYDIIACFAPEKSNFKSIIGYNYLHVIKDQINQDFASCVNH